MKKEKLVIFEAGITVFLLVLTGLPTNSNPNVSIEQATKIAVDTLLYPTCEGVAAVMYTENPDKIIVMVESEKYASLIPKQIEGFDTQVVVSGRIYALGYHDQQQSVELSEGGGGLPLRLSRTAHWPLLAGGISFGNAYSTSWTGTLGVCYTSGTSSYLVSCAHVIAMDNNGNFIPTGQNTRVYQPAKCYAGNTNVGYLYSYIPIVFNNNNYWNYADAAKALCTHLPIGNKYEVRADNNGYYSVSFTTTLPAAGQTVRLSGTTSGVATNTVYGTSATCTIWYTSTKWARYMDVIFVNRPFAQPGDSGSFVDKNGYFVGILFAQNGNYNVVCKAGYVKSGLGMP